MTKPFIRQAIITRYIGPTNYRGSRIKAKAAAGSVTLHYDSALNTDDNHARAEQALAKKFKWQGHYYGGGMPDECGNVYVQGPASNEAHFVVEG